MPAALAFFIAPILIFYMVAAGSTIPAFHSQPGYPYLGLGPLGHFLGVKARSKFTPHDLSLNAK